MKSFMTSEDWTDPQAYSTRSYWEEFYREHPDTFEWCLEYDDIKTELKAEVGGADKVLMLGCGNSNLTLEMYHDGWKDIVNVDYSPLVIETMSTRYQDYPELLWECMDARSLTFPENYFDAVVDKGLLDAMACSEAFDLYIPKIAQSCCKVLRENGKYFCTSFCQPSVIVPLLNELTCWQVNHKKIAQKFHLYVCHKSSSDHELT